MNNCSGLAISQTVCYINATYNAWKQGVYLSDTKPPLHIVFALESELHTLEITIAMLTQPVALLVRRPFQLCDCGASAAAIAEKHIGLTWRIN